MQDNLGIGSNECSLVVLHSHNVTHTHITSQHAQVTLAPTPLGGFVANTR